jgi:hypothetical protein
MDVKFSTHDGDEKCVQNFGRKILRNRLLEVYE